MKKKDFNDIKALDIKALQAKVVDLRTQVAELVLDKNMNKLKDRKQINKIKKDLAQILTVMNQKKVLAKFKEVAE